VNILLRAANMQLRAPHFIHTPHQLVFLSLLLQNSALTD